MLLPQSAFAAPQSRPVSLARPTIVVSGFAPGTLIETEDGALPVEHLFAGDRVAVMGGGFATLRAVNRIRALSTEVVVVPACSAEGLKRPLTLAAGHPVLLDDWRAQVVYGQPAILSKAAALADKPGVRLQRRNVQTLIQLEFDTPQAICANGLWLGCGTRAGKAASTKRAATGRKLH